MVIEFPKIDKRGFEELLKEFKSLIPFYTPQWKPSEMDAGWALVKIFCSMFQTIIQRLNKVPQKHFIAFLDKVGIKLLPAQPAKAPITFTLAEGTKEYVLVPEGTQVAARDIGFETEKSILVAPSKLETAYSIDVIRDGIYESPKNVITGEMAEDVTFELFEGDNLQEHILYLGHKDIFNIKSNKMKIDIEISPWDSKIGCSNLVSWQYWGEETGTQKLDWYNFTVKLENKKIILNKYNNDEIKEREINGIKSRWIRCKIKCKSKEIFKVKDITLDNIKIGVEPTEGILPDFAFYNDVPLDLSSPIYPFGKIPKLFDTFYIASQEAFSKKGAIITLTITRSMDREGEGTQTPKPLLSWEYWDGNGWVRIPGIEIKENPSILSLQIIIENFPEVKPVKVNGQENLWIRVRLIGGDYGKEIIVDGNTVRKGNVTPPKIDKITIKYTLSLQYPQHCLTYNNLEFRNVTEENKTKNKTFKPFIPLDDNHQTLYLGFDKKLEKGPISLFFLIEEQTWSADKIPKIEWEYYAEDGKWARLEVLDETRGFVRSTTIEFVFPPDFKKIEKFGKELYWIRAVDVNNIFKPTISIAMNYLQIPKAKAFVEGARKSRPILSRIIEEIYINPVNKRFYPKFSIAETFSKLKDVFVVSASEREKRGGNDLTPKMEPCPELLEFFKPEWLPEEIKKETPSPKIKGIFLNTTWAVQAETIKDEILGSSDGTVGQIYTLTKRPVISEEIWINEIKTISEEERQNILQKGEFKVKEVKDEKGNLIEFWIRWIPVESLLTSAKDDRHYEIDRVWGEVKFGDGVYGKIPSIGTNNIVANYRAGGGSQGNVAAYEIKDLKSYIAFIDKVFNPLAAAGGANIETIERAMERGPQILKNRNRAITTEDFEQIAYQASRAIARVKCLSNFDNKGKYKPGWVTVIVIPHSSEDKPSLSLQLKRQIENYLRDHSANTIVEKNRLQVSEPVYVEVSVNAVLNACSIDAIPTVEKITFSRLKKFLHPITGGYEGKGWEFGRLPHLSDFYALLENIEGVDFVKSISLGLMTYANEKIISQITISSGRPLGVKMPRYAIACSGKHKVTVVYEREKTMRGL